jgi:hypothetical protein
VPRQELLDAADGVIGDMREHMAQIGFGIEPVEPGRPDEGIEDSGAFASAVRAGEEVVATTDGNTAQGSLGCGVIDLDAAVVQVTDQCGPKRKRVVDRRRRIRLARECSERCL